MLLVFFSPVLINCCVCFHIFVKFSSISLLIRVSVCDFLLLLT